VNELSEYGAIELEELRKKFGKNALKLAENECIRAPPESLLDYIRKEMDGMRRYPTCNYSRLKKTIAGIVGEGCKSENIGAGNGSLEVLDLMMRTFMEPNDQIVMPVPTYYNAMRQAIVNFGDSQFVNTWPSLEINADKVLAASEGAKIIYLANPNNPTGKQIKMSEIEKIAKGAPDAAIFIDEAYHDYCDASAMQLLPKYPNLVLFRTFSKAYGLAGFRIGYAIAHPDIISAFDKIRVPFNVDIAAMAAVEWASKNAKWKDENVKETLKERTWVTSELRKISGMKPIESSTNFIMVFVEEASAIKEKLESEGIMISSFSDFPGLPCQNLRISIGKHDENERVINAIKKAVG